QTLAVRGVGGAAEHAVKPRETYERVAERGEHAGRPGRGQPADAIEDIAGEGEELPVPVEPAKPKPAPAKPAPAEPVRLADDKAAAAKKTPAPRKAPAKKAPAAKKTTPPAK
ncbi:hypothetical protein DMH12_22835, partial [Streptomyces sp. WAC 04229]